MNNTIYENEIIENKMTDLLNSKLDTRALMTVDTSLAENAGLRKVINRYTYNGKMENLAKGEKNTSKGTVSFVPEYYDVKRYQQTFEYNDMDAMADPYIVDVAMQGAVSEIANEINEEYISELMKISNLYAYDQVLTYSEFVDALATIDCEVDGDLFIIMGGQARKEIRKDPEFVTAKQGEIVYSGQFGTICGVPVIFSKLVPDERIIVTNKNAVRFFVKKDASVEQARDIETKDNTVVYERHGLIALVDDTNSILMGKGPRKLNWTVNFNGSEVSLRFNEDAQTDKYDYYYQVDCPNQSMFEGHEIDTGVWRSIDMTVDIELLEEERAGKTITIVGVPQYKNNVCSIINAPLSVG